MLDKLEADQKAAAEAAATAKPAKNISSAMSFDPINEEENEDDAPRASQKATGDDGAVAEENFSDDDKKDRKKSKKDKKDKKKKKSSKGDSDGRSKSKSKSQRSRSRSKKGTDDGGSAKSGKTAGASQQEEGGERMSAKSKMSYYSSKSKMKMEGGVKERSKSKKFDQQFQEQMIDSTRKLID